MIDAERVVVHRDRAAVGKFLIQRAELRFHLIDRLPNQILNEIRLMHAQIRHRAHRRALFVKEPRALAGIDAPRFRPAVAERRRKRDDAANLALLDQLARFHVRTGQALVLVDHKPLSALFRRADHAFAIRQRRRHRLFAQHMLARLQRRHRDFRMAGVCRADAHRVHVRVGEQRLDALIGSAAVLLGQRLRTRRVQIIKRDELCVRVVVVFGNMPHLRNLAAANDTDTKHVFFLP